MSIPKAFAIILLGIPIVGTQKVFMVPQMFPGVELVLPSELANRVDTVRVMSCLRTREIYLYAPGYPVVFAYETRNFQIS